MQLLAKWLLALSLWPFAFGHWLLVKITKTTATQNRKSVNRKLRIANYKLEVRIIRVAQFHGYKILRFRSWAITATKSFLLSSGRAPAETLWARLPCPRSGSPQSRHALLTGCWLPAPK